MRKEKAGQCREEKPEYWGSRKWAAGIVMREVVSIIETVTVEVEGRMLRGGGGFAVVDIVVN